MASGARRCEDGLGGKSSRARPTAVITRAHEVFYAQGPMKCRRSSWIESIHRHSECGFRSRRYANRPSSGYPEPEAASPAAMPLRSKTAHGKTRQFHWLDAPQADPRKPGLERRNHGMTLHRRRRKKWDRTSVSTRRPSSSSGPQSYQHSGQVQGR
ncbi:hypothetical protein D3C81_213100 [compost metagenome]